MPIVSRHALYAVGSKTRKKTPTKTLLKNKDKDESKKDSTAHSPNSKDSNNTDIVIFLHDILKDNDKMAIVQINTPSQICPMYGAIYPCDR
eukprot:UN16622